jgi:hypothetical protein
MKVEDRLIHKHIDLMLCLEWLRSAYQITLLVSPWMQFDCKGSAAATAVRLRLRLP